MTTTLVVYRLHHVQLTFHDVLRDLGVVRMRLRADRDQLPFREVRLLLLLLLLLCSALTNNTQIQLSGVENGFSFLFRGNTEHLEHS